MADSKPPVPDEGPDGVVGKVTISGQVTPETLRQGQSPAQGPSTPRRPAPTPQPKGVKTAVMRDPELTEAHKQLRAAVMSALNRIERSIDAVGSHSTDATSPAEQLQLDVDALREALVALKKRLDATGDQSDARHTSVIQSLDELKSLARELESAERESRQRQDEAARDQQQQLDTVRETAAGWQQVAESIARLPQTVSDQLAGPLNELRDRVASDQHANRQLLNERAEALHKHVDDCREGMNDRLSEMAGSLEQRVSETGRSADEQIRSLRAVAEDSHQQLNDLRGSIQALQVKAESADTQAKRLQQTADSTNRHVVQLDEALKQVVAMRKAIEELPDRVEGELVAHRSAMSAKMTDLERGIGAMNERIDALRQELNDLFRKQDTGLRRIGLIRNVLWFVVLLVLAGGGAAVWLLLQSLGVV